MRLSGAPCQLPTYFVPSQMSRAAKDRMGLCSIATWPRVMGKVMKYKLFSGVVFAVAVTIVIPSGITGVSAADARAVAEGGSDRVGAGRVASDGADHVGAGQVASDGADHVGAGQVASDGSDRVGANRLAADGSDHIGAARLAFSSRAGVGSDRVAETYMSSNYSDQFNTPR